MSSEKQTNTLRLIRLLNEGGTDALRNVFDAKFPPATLGASLASRPLHTTLQILLRNKVLNLSQWDKLYPAVPGTPDSKTFDISLLYVLLRNICGLKSPKDPLWTSNPPAADRSVEANIARVRLYRNDVIHDLASGVDDVAFQNYWTDICSALKDLGIPQAELDALKDSHLDEKKYTDMLLEWKREEQLLLEKADETLAEVKGMKRQMLSKDEILLENQKLQCQIKEAENKAEAKAEEILAEMKAVKQMMSQGQETSKEEVLRKLAKINFTQEMNSQAKKCHPGTREWIFSKVEDWFRDEESESRAMIILGDPGMGKTIIAAKVCQRMQTSGNLGGMHFCIHGNKRYMNAKLMLQSLANSLCNVLSAYRIALIDLLSHNLGEDQDLDKMSVEELFCFLLQEPLSEVPAPKEPFLFVVDALDEADYHGRNELMDVMSSYFARLPSWLKFLVTSRSDANAKSKLEDLCPLEITPDLKRNVEDLELFLREKLQAFVPAEWLDAILDLSLEKSQGQMLHAHCTIEFLSKTKDISWEHLKSIVPGKISQWYKHYTDRLKQGLGVTDIVFSRFLAALVSSREPLPTDMIPWLLKLEAGEGPRIVEAIEAVSSLLPLREGKVCVFHKSFTDWLTEPQPQTYGIPRARVTEMQGHQVLGEVCSKILESLKNKAKVPEDFSPCEVYALKHGLRHMLEVAEGDAQGMQLKKMLLDLEVLILKLIHCTVYDVIEEYGDCAGKLSPDAASTVEEIKHILGANSSFLSARPQSIFEQIVNEAECDELISQAHELLEKDKYWHTWMEVINRKDKSEILVEVAVNTEIGDFEVSPDGKMLAVNGGNLFSDHPSELSLWSIISGKPIWRKTFTLSKNTLFQDCCTFSPDGSLILFGRLDQVFHLDGNLQPYFDGIHHEYGKCQFSYDGKRLLTNSEDGGLLLWDVDKRLQLHSIPLMADFLVRETSFCWKYIDFIFSRCGRYIVSVTLSRIFLWNSAGEKLDSIDMGHPILSCHLDCVSPPSGGHLLFMSSKLTRVVLKISSSQLVKYNEDYNATVEFIFSRDGKQGTAIVTQSGQHVNEELSCCPIRVGSFFGNGWKFKFVDDGSLIKQPMKSNTLQVVRTSKGAEYKDDTASLHKSIISACTFSGEGSRLYTYEHSDDGSPHEAPKVFVYDVNDREATTGIVADFPVVLTDGKVLVFYQCKCEVWDSDLNNVLWTWECEQDAKPLCAADEIGVFMGGRAGEVMACDVQTGHVKFTLTFHDHQVKQGWINHHNSRLITTDSVNYYPDMEHYVILWDVDSHKVKTLLGDIPFDTHVADCSFSSEKELVAVLYTSGNIHILNELSGNTIRRLYLPSVCSTCFVHGTNLLAFADHASLFVVDVSNYDERLAVIRFMKPNSFPLRLCYSPCSRKFAVAGFSEILLVEVHLPNLVTRTGAFR